MIIRLSDYRQHRGERMYHSTDFKVGDLVPHRSSAVHQFLMSHTQNALSNLDTMDEVDPEDRFRIRPTRPGKPHLICHNGWHYQVTEKITATPTHPHQPFETEIKIEMVGRCKRPGWCSGALEFRVLFLYHSRLRSIGLLEHFDALGVVPEGKVLYQVGENGHLAYFKAGADVPKHYLKTWKVLNEGESVKTTKTDHYGPFGAREVWTWYTFTNYGGKIHRTQRGG